MDTAASTQVSRLIRFSGLIDKIGSYDLRGEFVTNIDLDQNGIDFLNQHGDEITFVGKTYLVDNYISDERDLPKQKVVQFDIYGVSYAEHLVGDGVKTVIAPVKAKELVELDGIKDQSLFTYNVRGPLGRTSVNKALDRSVRNKSTHKNFPLFHNGVTIITRDLSVSKDSIEIGGYYVVNGCQSVTSLHDNKKHITDDLKLLTKFIQMDPVSAEAKQITEYSNNQNGVRARDFKSNSAIQIRLRQEFAQHYKGKFNFEIKRGETSSKGVSISNEEAGLYMMAFDLGEPWGTHRKYEVFDDKHNALFGRPHVTADRIVMLHTIYTVVKEKASNLKSDILAKYKLTRYVLMYILREVLSEDRQFIEILNHPDKYMRNPVTFGKFRDIISSFISGFVIDINAEIKYFDKDFDYRRAIKNEDWVKKLTLTIHKDFEKNVEKGKQDTFEQEWNKKIASDSVLD